MLVGKEGSGGNGEGRKRDCSEEKNLAVTVGCWASSFNKSTYSTARGTLVKFSGLQLVLCSLHTPGQRAAGGSYLGVGFSS